MVSHHLLHLKNTDFKTLFLPMSFIAFLDQVVASLGSTTRRNQLVCFAAPICSLLLELVLIQCQQKVLAEMLMVELQQFFLELVVILNLRKDQEENRLVKMVDFQLEVLELVSHQFLVD